MASSSEPLWTQSVIELARMLRERRVSAVELAEELLKRIEALNPTLHAYVAVDPEVTLAQAREAQATLDTGNDQSVLLGIPVSLKDAFDTSEMPTTYGARAFASHRPSTDSHVAWVLRKAGAVLLGKTNLLEFCWGPTESYPFGKVSNPWKVTHSPGGSSNGAGAAVAAGLGPIGIGTDTGGSVRNPAAFCGLVGLKPTFGRIGRTAMFPLSFTLDHVGVLARRVEDVALVLEVLASPDPMDFHSLDQPPPYRLGLTGDAARPILLLPRAHFWENLESEVESCVESAVEVFRSLGYTAKTVEVAHAANAHRAVEGILLPEAAWRHQRTVAEHPEGLSEAFRSRVARGLEVPVTSYVAALHARQEFRRALASSVADDALLLLPSSPYPAYPLTDPMATGSGRVNRDIGQCTGPFNVAGTPAVTLPCGFTRDGLPVGVQLVGPWGDEAMILRAALAYERATEWWRMWPPLARNMTASSPPLDKPPTRTSSLPADR